MAKIDDSVGEIEEQYFPQEDWERQLADEITDKTLLPLIPKVGWLVVLIRNFIKGRTTRLPELSSRRDEMFIARSGPKIFSPLGSGDGHFREAMFFIIIVGNYKHFAPPERQGIARL